MGRRLVQHREHGHRVVAVDLLRRDAVADPLVRQRRSRGLLRERDADRVLVVLDDEHDRRLEHGGEVERLVEVALAGRAVTDERQGDGAAALARLAVREARGVDELGGQRRALGRRPRRHRVVAAVPVTAQQGQHLDRVDAAGDQRDGVAVGREDPVAGLQRQHRADLAGLLAARGGVDREAALLGQRGGLDVEPAADDHPAVGLDQLLGRRLGVVVDDRLHPPAVVVQEPDRQRRGHQPARER